jgi:CheY-like chemotaxis protein
MPLKVLVADDNKLLLNMTTDALTEAGYDVIGVESGLEVYKLVLSEKPQVVLLDIMMPGIDGIEVCRNLKRSPVTKNTLIIIHSGKTDMALMDLCFAAGAEGYIIKTNDFEGMVKKVAEITAEKLAGRS